MSISGAFKEYIRKCTWIRPAPVLAVVGGIGALITPFVFFSGIQSFPEVVQKLWGNASENSAPPSTFYTVRLLLPARMNGAEIFVDGQPALLVQQTATVVTVQVSRKATGHQFTARKGEDVCSKPPQLIRENNVIIYPCQ